MFRYQSARLNVAAGTEGRLYFAPLGASEKWKVRAVVLIPNASTSANGTNYAAERWYKGSTAITASRDTSSTGFTQGTAIADSLTGTGADLEIDRDNPLNLRVTHTASGAAVDVTAHVEYEVLR